MRVTDKTEAQNDADVRAAAEAAAEKLGERMDEFLYVRAAQNRL